jgi:hypothetical protein
MAVSAAVHSVVAAVHSVVAAAMCDVVIWAACFQLLVFVLEGPEMGKM